MTVSVDLDTLEALRRSNSGTGLVFLPAHRSYMDPLVLGKVLREHDFPPNHVLGGINMSFWPLGPMGRRAGVIFIRRSRREGGTDVPPSDHCPAVRSWQR